MNKTTSGAFTFIKTLFFKVSKNVFWLICLSITTAACQFLVYAFINKNLGKEILGVWSLVIAATSIGQISNFGFSNGLVRYLPELISKNEREKISKLVSTIHFANFFLSLPVLFLLYFPAVKYAAYLLAPHQFQVFKSIIIWCMAGLFINNLFSVYSYLLDGMQKYYLRCLIQISGWIFFMISSVMLMPFKGIYGVALAFFFQSIWQLVIAYIIVAKNNYIPGGFEFGFDKKIFRMVSSFGIKSQAVSVLVIFFDPIVKFFITKNIGLIATANYEIANKIVIQVRNLLVSANQVIIPTMVINKSHGLENSYFDSMSRRNIILSVCAGIFVLLTSPLIILFFSGKFDPFLMNIIVVLNFGWICNMITSLHYYSCTSFDRLNSVIIYHFILAIFTCTTYFIISNFTHNDYIYFYVPPIVLFVGSIYNSYALSDIIDAAFSWLKSIPFLYITFGSIFFLVYSPKTILSAYGILIILSSVFFIWLWCKYNLAAFIKNNKS